MLFIRIFAKTETTPYWFLTYVRYSSVSLSMILQKELIISAKTSGFHLITDEIVSQLGPLPNAGLLHLFIKHTSCGLSLNENYDPDVRRDLREIFSHLVPERQSYYTHVLEGDDDMPAHAKSALVGVDLTIPITNHRLNLGTWQGIYLCEFRNHGGPRRVVATIYE